MMATLLSPASNIESQSDLAPESIRMGPEGHDFVLRELSILLIGSASLSRGACIDDLGTNQQSVRPGSTPKFLRLSESRS